MKERCYEPSVKSYWDYGGRGITVCDKWLYDFPAFLADMGPCPPGMTIDRIDNDRGYGPGNCRWATDVEQANNTRRNRRVAFDGETMTVTEWSRRLGVSTHCIVGRLSRGWPTERALTTPAVVGRNQYSK